MFIHIHVVNVEVIYGSWQSAVFQASTLFPMSAAELFIGYQKPKLRPGRQICFLSAHRALTPGWLLKVFCDQWKADFRVPIISTTTKI